jgi:hypothetical protein
MKWDVKNAVSWEQTEAIEISLMDCVDDSTGGFPLSAYICNAFQFSGACVNRSLPTFVWTEQNSSTTGSECIEICLGEKHNKLR